MQLPCLPPLQLSTSQFEEMERAFAALTAALSRHKSLDVRSLGDFMAPMAEQTQRVAVRCDVAGDPARMLPLARHAARSALPTTFFFSHREEYFASEGWLPPFLVAGPEIGMKVIPWLRGDASFSDAAIAVAAAIADLRHHGAIVSGLAFDPPCHGVAAEPYELFQGWSLNGRDGVPMGDAIVPLQTLDMTTLCIRFTTMFGQQLPFSPAGATTYFALAEGSAYGSQALRQVYWSKPPLWNLHGITTVAYVGKGNWLRYDGGSDSLPEPHGNVASLVEWIAATGNGRRYQFVFDPRLITS